MAERKKSEPKQEAAKEPFTFDVKESKEGDPYLAITESRYKGEDEERERRTIIVFPEQAEEFAAAVVAMAQKLN